MFGFSSGRNMLLIAACSAKASMNGVVSNMSMVDKQNIRQVVVISGKNNKANVAGNDITESIEKSDTKKDSSPHQGNSKRRVFIVHGRDDITKDAVAHFLEKLGLEVIILHEQPNEGRTIIEKLEYYSSLANYAIILLTPDDVGGIKLNKPRLSPRARQNVVFEMGYFYASIGRGKVCALYKDVELPSDLHGVLYISLDPDGKWKAQLITELQKAELKT
jgi:predicted nucleotide-binding protein